MSVPEKTDDLNKRKINVIEEYDYSTQSKSYSNSFKYWRKQKENPFSFSFEMNPKESIYVDGRGFMVGSVQAAEKEALIRVFYIIGVAALMWIVINNVFSKLLIFVMSLAGMNIHFNSFTDSLYGGHAETVTVSVVINLAKIMIPALYLLFRFRLPPNVSIMNSRHDSQGLISAIGMILVCCTVMSLPSLYTDDIVEVYSFLRLNTDVSVWSQSEFILYSVFHVLILAAAEELFFRGAMFAVLRQFGDKFAVIMTTVTAVLLADKVDDIIPTILVSLIASYGMLRSGSIFTAIVVNIIHRMNMLAIYVIESDSSNEMIVTGNVLMLFMFCFGTILILFSWLLSKMRYKKTFVDVTYELSLKDKVLHSLKVFPYSAVAAISIVYIIVRAVL
ncbi:MAG: CPBP family intramembrane metalloprotease [Ruminococcus sp.]|nr:CPBP family intramembrane metalloprotease [Ruminococcus sp.]